MSASLLLTTNLAHSEQKRDYSENPLPKICTEKQKRRDLILEFAGYAFTSNYVCSIEKKIPGYKAQITRINAPNFEEKRIKFVEKAVKREFVSLLDAIYEKKTSNPDLEKIQEYMISELKKEDTKYCKFDNPKFKKALSNLVRQRTDFLESLVNSPLPTKSGKQGWKELMSSLHPNKFRQHLNKLNEAIHQYYDEMYVSMPWKYKLLGLARESFEIMKRETIKANTLLFQESLK